MSLPFELCIPLDRFAHGTTLDAAEHVMMHVRLIQEGIDKQIPGARVAWSCGMRGENFFIHAEAEPA